MKEKHFYLDVSGIRSGPKKKTFIIGNWHMKYATPLLHLLLCHLIVIESPSDQFHVAFSTAKIGVNRGGRSPNCWRCPLLVQN